MTHYNVDMSDTEDSVATKPELWRPIADAIGGFDVDPASGAENESIAETVYTKEDDGLSQQWEGNVWLNPPFGNKGDWYKKAVNEYNTGNADMVVMLAPVDPSTQWYQQWFSQADLHCYLEGRDWFSVEGSPNFSTVVGVFGDYPTSLIPVLDRKGTVLKPMRPYEQERLG